PYLVGARQGGHVLARLRQGDGIALAGVQVGAHQVHDRGRLTVELQRGRRQFGFRRGNGGDWLRLRLPIAPDEEAEPDQAEQHQASQAPLSRYETWDQQLATRSPLSAVNPM